jgi:outer membrane protein assembly factor BamA
MRVLHLSAETRGVRRINNDAVPFWSLPILGGEDHLRGFPVDRFRDYVTLLLSAQYRYPIFGRFNGCLFVDFGSAAPAWESFELSDFRTGYGWELLTHISDDFVFKFQVAHGRDGFQLYVGTSTVLDLAEKGLLR